MNPKNIFATFIRILRQLKHDKRTVVLVLFIPSFIITILYFVLYNQRHDFDAFAPLIMVVMGFTALFIVASISTLRERRTGTLDRLMTMPISKIDLILGYAIAFGVLAVAQSFISIIVTFLILGVEIGGTVLQVILLTAISGLAGMSFGLLVSEYAKTEFQAVQFMPAFVFPQMLICGLLIPIEQMPGVLQWMSNIMPLTYIVEGIKDIVINGGWSGLLLTDLLVVFGFSVVALFIGAFTLRRQS